MRASAPRLTYLGHATSRGCKTLFGIKAADRTSHIHILGKTGVGKSSLLQTLVQQDIQMRRGGCLVDPHGDIAAEVALWAQSNGRAVTVFDAADPQLNLGYNPLRRVRLDRVPLAASGLLDTFRKLWPDAWGVRMEHVLRCSLYTLLERSGSTLPDILRLFARDDFRREVTRRTRNPVVRAFWLDEFEQYPARYRAEVVAPIQNKLGALLADPTLYRILVEPEVDLHFRRIMDQGGVLLVNLAKGRLGEDSSATLGSLLVSTIGLAALSRADVPSETRRPFFLYVDEFQSFTTLAFANMMSELRKYGLGLTLAHQHFHQLEPEVRHAVLGNAGTLISFRVGPEDAQILAQEFQPTFCIEDLLNLPNRHYYLRLMIDGSPSRPFSAVTLDKDHFLQRAA
ncbi:MAG: type IV secretory system conjugative DNA transfer family protein [Pseudomonadota bacterium]